MAAAAPTPSPYLRQVGGRSRAAAGRVRLGPHSRQMVFKNAATSNETYFDSITQKKPLPVVTLPFSSLLFLLFSFPLLGPGAADGGGSVLCAVMFNVSSKYRGRWVVYGGDLHLTARNVAPGDCPLVGVTEVPQWTTSLPLPA